MGPWEQIAGWAPVVLGALILVAVTGWSLWQAGYRAHERETRERVDRAVLRAVESATRIKSGTHPIARVTPQPEPARVQDTTVIDEREAIDLITIEQAIDEICAPRELIALQRGALVDVEVASGDWRRGAVAYPARRHKDLWLVGVQVGTAVVVCELYQLRLPR